MIEVHGQRKRQERRPVLVRLAPETFRLLAEACDSGGRTYGEFISLLLHERQLRLQAAKQDARQSA
jgi:hypothetical protein